MSQLIKATVTPFESVQFRQNASLVSEQQLDAARRHAMARQQAFRIQNSIHSSTGSSEYMNQVRSAYSNRSVTPSVPQPDSAPTVAQTHVPQVAQPQVQTSNETPQVNVQDVAQATYTQDRGAFEMRVAKGELTYVPPLVMTVITQYPDVKFEYLGEAQYVPPSSAPTGENIDLSL